LRRYTKGKLWVKADRGVVGHWFIDGVRWRASDGIAARDRWYDTNMTVGGGPTGGGAGRGPTVNIKFSYLNDIVNKVYVGHGDPSTVRPSKYSSSRPPKT